MSRATASYAACLLMLLATAGGSLAPSARAGDYAVRITSTSSPFWRTYGRGPFVHSPSRVHSAAATFQAGDYGSWRAVVPAGEGLRIVGGRIVTTLQTPHEQMRGRILVGTGNTPIVLYDGDDTATIDRSITAGSHDWIQFDVRSAGTATTTREGGNFINLNFADLVLRDVVAPVVGALSLPSAATWHAAGACIPFSLRLTDQGGGLLRSRVRRAADGLVITELEAPQVQSLKPGPTEQHLSDCIQPHERWHGDTAYVATVWDVGGTATELAFTVRADHAAPTVGGGPAAGTRFTTARPDLRFDVGDVGSGVASVWATIDGNQVPVAVSGGVARLDVGALSIGRHEVAVAVRDVAGNDQRTSREFTIADATAPVLVVESPTARGEATAFLSVRASDDMSGVDPTRWVATVNGEPVASQGNERQLTASVGPLAPGRHQLSVKVADRSGNVATIDHAYEVASAPVPSMPDVGARSGVFVVEPPTGILPFGSTAATSVFVARNGRPMPGQRVEVRRDGEVRGSATTDQDGIARVPFRAGAPGPWSAAVVGTTMEPAHVALRVAPRLVLRTSTRRPRVGARVWLSGRVLPALPGRRIAIEARAGARWYPISRTAVVRADGTFRSHVVATTSGRIGVRVRIAPADGWSEAVSRAASLAVRRRPAPSAVGAR